MSGQPSVIVFLSDQQRWDSTSIHGGPAGITPNFDRLAREGTHFTHAFTPQPVCGPARSCFQTGRYASTNGCPTNGCPLPTDVPTLAGTFREAGYTTGYIGKWHLAGRDNGPGAVPRDKRGGYEHWLGAEALELCSHPYDCVLYDQEDRRRQLPGYRVDAVTDAALQFIHEHQREPFLLFISYIEPHQQNDIDEFVAPHGYAEKYRDAVVPTDLQSLDGPWRQHLPGYYGMVKSLDESLGRLMETLADLSLLDHSVLAMTSDHGCHFRTRNAKYKQSCHEASIRVPFAIRGQGIPTRQDDRLVSLLNLAPTLLSAAGLSVPSTMQGRSLIDPSGAVSEGQGAVLIEMSHEHPGRAIRTRRWKYGVLAEDVAADQPQAERYTETWLYDLEQDPYEHNNLARLDSHRDIAVGLAEQLQRLLESAGQGFVEITR